MNALDVLRELLATKAANWTPEDRQLVETVAADIVRLQALQLAGQNVDAELLQVRAAAASLAAASAVGGAAILGEWAARVAGALGTFLLTGVRP